MSIIRGHEDLKPKAIVGFEMGYALVQCDEGVKRYKLLVTAGGGLAAKPVEEESGASVDQLTGAFEPDLRARRYANIDQPIQ